MIRPETAQLKEGHRKEKMVLICFESIITLELTFVWLYRVFLLVLSPASYDAFQVLGLHGQLLSANKQNISRTNKHISNSLVQC